MLRMTIAITALLATTGAATTEPLKLGDADLDDVIAGWGVETDKELGAALSLEKKYLSEVETLVQANGGNSHVVIISNGNKIVDKKFKSGKVDVRVQNGTVKIDGKVVGRDKSEGVRQSVKITTTSSSKRY